MLEFSLQSSVLKFTQWYQIQRKASQREGGGGSERGGRLAEPAGSQRGDGHLLRINCFTRGCAGDICWLFALDRAGQEVSGLVVPRDPEWPQPSSPAPWAAARACSLLPEAALRFPEFYRRGKAEPQDGSEGSHPRGVQLLANKEVRWAPGAGAAGLLLCDWSHVGCRFSRPGPHAGEPAASFSLFPQSDALRALDPQYPSRKSSKLLPLFLFFFQCNERNVIPPPSPPPND